MQNVLFSKTYLSEHQPTTGIPAPPAPSQKTIAGTNPGKTGKTYSIDGKVIDGFVKAPSLVIKNGNLMLVPAGGKK